jgi:hypothetical protein
MTNSCFQINTLDLSQQEKTSIATVKHSWLHCKELDFDAIEILCLLPNLLVGYLFLLSGW